LWSFGYYQHCLSAKLDCFALVLGLLRSYMVEALMKSLWNRFKEWLFFSPWDEEELSNALIMDEHTVWDEYREEVK
jgi:hypothetical protein